MVRGSAKSNKSGVKTFLSILYVVSFAVIFYLTVDGFSFYKTSYMKRPRHEDYRVLRPAGLKGHAFGIIGSAMMLFMLLYSIRKRTGAFGKLGRLKSWLDIHIYFGITGPLLIILHTSFKVQGLVAVSFWSMVAVALSGVFGRYLYLQIPRDIEGEQLGIQEIERLKDEISNQLNNATKFDQNQMEFIEKSLSLDRKEKGGLFMSLWAILSDDLMRPLKIRRFRRKYLKKLDLPDELGDRILILTLDKSLLNRKIAFFNQVQTLFHYWHVFHKPFAIIMYLIMLVHVAVAVWLGYVWMF